LGLLGDGYVGTTGLGLLGLREKAVARPKSSASRGSVGKPFPNRLWVYWDYAQVSQHTQILFPYILSATGVVQCRIFLERYAAHVIFVKPIPNGSVGTWPKENCLEGKCDDALVSGVRPTHADGSRSKILQKCETLKTIQITDLRHQVAISVAVMLTRS
jgi:hypothetical protein